MADGDKSTKSSGTFVPSVRIVTALTQIASALESLPIAERGHVMKRVAEMYLSSNPSKDKSRKEKTKKVNIPEKKEKDVWRSLWEADETYKVWKELIKAPEDLAQLGAEERTAHDTAYAEAQGAAMVMKGKLKNENPPPIRPEPTPSKKGKGKGKAPVTAGDRPLPTDPTAEAIGANKRAGDPKDIQNSESKKSKTGLTAAEMAAAAAAASAADTPEEGE